MPLEQLLKDAKEKAKKHEDDLELLKKEYNRFKLMLGQTQQGRSRRTQNATTFEIISDFKSSTRYRRRQETKEMLEYIHGGDEGALYGAWDFLASFASKEIIDKLISSYKRGKYLQGVFGTAVKDFNNSEEALKQAVAVKFQNYLSRRKFNLVCKTQSSVYDADQEVWLPRNIKCMDAEIALPKIVSDLKVDHFVKSLDIGHVCQISNYSGASRTVTGLVFMILDLHLRLPRFHKQLIWFNGNKYHFIFQFSDDGAPETSELAMSIGSLTCWNFGSRVRSREFHYLLHCLSVSEKESVMEDIWKQHTEEMRVLEGNIFTVRGQQRTLEFQPSADQSWQSWANNELNQAATYPSPYANVHKGQLSKMGGNIGNDSNCTWQVPTQEKRQEDLGKVQAFQKTLPKDLNPTQGHKKTLEFMANNGLRQLGEPRIGEFANRQRPEPVHNEINAWQHILNMIYKEALQRNTVDLFLEVLSSPVDTTEIANIRLSRPQLTTPHQEGVGERVRQVDIVNRQAEVFNENMQAASVTPDVSGRKPGCGLSFVASKIREHHNDKDHRANNLSTRLIGEQAIALAKYSYRLIDALEITDESSAQKMKRQALGKAAEHLRNAGTLFNKVDTNLREVEQINENLTTYFNLLSLFYSSSVNITVWTVAYAIPYHASLLFEKYNIGFGILSLQAKESKHSGIKHDLVLTNRSRSTGKLGKWWQVMRANYVRAFYLPEHHPMPSMYISHYESRMPSHITKADNCQCGRKKSSPEEQLCNFCVECKTVLECAAKQQLLPAVIEILKPVACPLCEERFADKPSCDQHVTFVHSKGMQSSREINPRALIVSELKRELSRRGLVTSGSKDVLCRRLEGQLASEL